MIVNAGANSTDEQIALLVNAINDNLTELRTDIQAQIDQISNAVDSATFNAVKSIQRGVVTGNTTSKIEIAINPVNPDKCMVLLNSSWISDTNTTTFSYLVSITETVLTIGANRPADYSSKEISWQVVEFY